jgi:hypothetical protein
MNLRTDLAFSDRKKGASLIKPFSVTLSIAAGLLGGTVAPYMFRTTYVHAQAQILAPKVLEAGVFRLVNETGHTAGTITINAAGSGVITMFDADGKVIFTTESKPIIKPASEH